MDKNKDWCSFPDEAINRLKDHHAKNAGFNAKACTVAAKMKKMKEQAAQGGGPAGPTVARRTALTAAPRGRRVCRTRGRRAWSCGSPRISRFPSSSSPASTGPPDGNCCSRHAGRRRRSPASRSHRGPNLWHLALFLVGAIAMRGAGCTYNDILDRKLDAGVERTRNRPLPSGRVSVRAAASFLVAQSLVGLAVLVNFNRFSIWLGVASLGVVAVYPLMKRVTSWPQAVLGLAFSWGALIGWSATFASLALAPILLYLSAFAWTIGYDTIYAMQDARDDAIVGIRSTARLFGEHTRLGVGLFYAAARASGACWRSYSPAAARSR